jgi:predicted ArsR family transcriptional regulator
MTPAKRRLVDHLKRVDGATVAEMADHLGTTGAAVRQHLDQLGDQGLIRRLDPSADRSVGPAPGRGRPAARWGLTDEAARLFPDRHADLTVDLIDVIRAELGEDGLDRIVTARTRRQHRAYSEVLVGLPLSERARRLAELRSIEGYEAEVVSAVGAPDGAKEVGGADGAKEAAGADDGALTLTEHHCPICDAAEACQGICRDELALFRELFGDVATVERTSHLLSGDQRCSYRITPRSASS